jgi:hypothetical protein
MAAYLLRFFALLMIASSAYLYAEESELIVNTDGDASIENRDIAKAKARALNDALDSAVRISLVNTFDQSFIKEKDTLIKEKLAGRARKFITSFKITSDSSADPKNKTADVIKISVEATVSLTTIRDYLIENGISVSKTVYPKILPLIVEKIDSDTGGTFWWEGHDTNPNSGFKQKTSFSDIEQALAKYFADASYTFMDPYSSSIKVPEAYRYMELKAPDMSAIGKLCGAELVATGFVWTRCKDDKLLSETSCDTTLSLQILDTRTGRIVASKRVSEQGKDAKSDNARTISRAKACKGLTDSLLYQMNNSWRQRRISSNFKIILRNIKDYSTYFRLKSILDKSVKGLSKALEREQTRNYIVFEGERNLDASAVHQGIINSCSSEYKIVVRGRGDDFIDLELL